MVRAENSPRNHGMTSTTDSQQELLDRKNAMRRAAYDARNAQENKDELSEQALARFLGLPQYVQAIRDHLEPQDKDWFAYKMSEPGARATVARTMSALTGLDWDAADIQMTSGGFGALAVAFRTLLDEGDEAIYLSPPWFFYELLIRGAESRPVNVRLDPPGFSPDPQRLADAITPRTRAVLINTPHNPSGRVLDADGQPVGGAFVRLLDGTDEFTAEVVASATGDFRFFAAPGTWKVRALSSVGNGDSTISPTAAGVHNVDVTVAK